MPIAATVPASSAQAATQTVGATALPAATEDGTVAVDLAPSASSILRLDQDLQLTVTVANDTADPLQSGTVDVYLAGRALTTRTALNNWLDPESGQNLGDVVVSVPMENPVPAHGTVTLDVTVPNESLGLFEWSSWGPRGIAALLSTDKTVRAQAQSTFVWYPESDTVEITPARLSVIMPITTPASSEGLIPAEDLAAYTGAAGVLSRQLDGVYGRAVIIAIDPRIIASIRALGTSAPPSAREWLDRLAAAPNAIFPLGYADADPSLTVQAGASEALVPLSFDQELDPALFPPSSEPNGEPEPDAGTPGTDIPTPESTETATEPPVQTGTVPTTEELLAWDYTTTGIAWPADNAVAAADLEAFAEAGTTATILSSGNVTDDGGSVTPSATTDLGDGMTGLVADTGISQAMRAAITAEDDDSWRAAIAELSSQIAVVAAENPEQARTLVATFDRGWPTTTTRLSQTIDALAGMPWYTNSTLQQTLDTPVATAVTFSAQSEPAGSVDLAGRLIDREAELVAFSDALADPVAITAPQRLELLALLGSSWADEPGEWRTATGASLTASHDVLRSVTVTTKGPINVVGSKVDIPVTLNNSLDQAVTARVQVVPSNGRLVVGDVVEATIDANSARSVSVPVTAAVGNGAVNLTVTLFTPSGTAIAQPSVISVNVRADWENIGSRIFAALVVLFFGFGIWRNIVHRRHDKKKAVDGAETPDTGTPPDLDLAPEAKPLPEPPTAPRG